MAVLTENFCESLFHPKRQCNIIEPTPNRNLEVSGWIEIMK